METGNASLAELLIVACSEAWRDNGEVVATGIGIIPRLAAGLAKLTHSPELMMTDGEAFLVEDPVPIGPRGHDEPRAAGFLPFSRFFDAAVWTGRRHAMVTPAQVDRFGQMNLSCLGGTYERPKVQMLGVRGFPGNTISHPNSIFAPIHSRRTFVPGEVDMVSSVGYNPERRTAGCDFSQVDLRLIVTDLCVMDFGGEDHAIRLRSLHPGITCEQIAEVTGFAVVVEGAPPQTPMPTAEQIAAIGRLDPHGLRATVIKGDPPADRRR